MKCSFFSFYFNARAIMCPQSLQAQVALHKQGDLLWAQASSTEAPSPVQPNWRLLAFLPCQATSQPAGSKLQLQHLNCINLSGPTLWASRCVREKCGSSPRIVGASTGLRQGKKKLNKKELSYLFWSGAHFLS